MFQRSYRTSRSDLILYSASIEIAEDEEYTRVFPRIREQGRIYCYLEEYIALIVTNT